MKRLEHTTRYAVGRRMALRLQMWQVGRYSRCTTLKRERVFMTINLPTDGFGVYESISSSLGSGTWGPRLDQIAAGGFKLVLNYGLLFGSIAQITSYINYAASKGLKVIVAIHNAVIWDTVGSPTSADLAAEYPTIYAAAGSPTSNWSQVF